MRGIGRTDVGRVRTNNEDSILIKNEPVGALPNLYVVADGMGGHKAGEVASSLAIESCCEYVRRDELGGGEILDTLIDAVRYANYRVYELSLSNESCSNMGTTFVGCSISGNTAYIVHVGDSRLYRIGSDYIEQITSDHSFVGEMVRAGKITPEEAENHPDRNIITRALGTNNNVEADGIVLNVADGDILLICSDGLNTMLKNDRIMEIVKDSCSLEQRLNMLIDSANESGGKDNISAILIDFGEGNEL
jgi:protein phosphatase